MKPYWSNESILARNQKYYSPNDIFQEVCNSLGNHFEGVGYKYYKSTRKITKVIKDFTIETCFWSSRSNTQGSYVNLEIVTSIYYKKSRLTKKRKGNYVLGHTIIDTELDYTQDNGTKTVLCINGDQKIFNESLDYALISRNTNVNVYEITFELFELIVNFINHQTNVIDVLYDKTQLMDFLKSRIPYSKKTLLREDLSFIEFVEDYYGDTEWVKEILI